MRIGWQNWFVRIIWHEKGSKSDHEFKTQNIKLNLSWNVFDGRGFHDWKYKVKHFCKFTNKKPDKFDERAFQKRHDLTITINTGTSVKIIKRLLLASVFQWHIIYSIAIICSREVDVSTSMICTSSGLGISHEFKLLKCKRKWRHINYTCRWKQVVVLYHQHLKILL